MTPGTKLALGVMRNGKLVALNLTVGQFHGNAEVAANDSDDEPGGAKTGKLGLAVSNLTADARQQINAPDQLKGVVSRACGRPAGRRGRHSAGRRDSGSEPQAGGFGERVCQRGAREPAGQAAAAAGVVEGQRQLQDDQSGPGQPQG